MIKAIIFDYDGVIVDSFTSVFEIYQEICKHFKVPSPQTIEEFRATYGYNYIECLINLNIDEYDFSEASSIYRREIVKKEPDIFTGIATVIKELAKKYKIYLVSASYRQEILPRMEKFALLDFFEKIYHGAEQRLAKSDMITSLLATYHYSPAEVISIGDRAIDYAASKLAGISDNNIILVSYGWGLDKNKIGQARIADKPQELLNLISNTRD